MSDDRYYLTAKQAADALGVTKATLYAYASRGQLRSEPAPAHPRERRYVREDIERLRERKETRRDPAKAAARGLHWGSPVLESGITLIQDGRLYYRGRDAAKLAETATLEEAAGLLWDVEASERHELFAQRHALSAGVLARLRSFAQDPLAGFQAALPVAGAVDLASFDLRPAAVRRTGARILRLLTAMETQRDSPASMHLALRQAWGLRKQAAEAIRAALVLCADHELNVSTFTARCAASAAASPYDVVSAAMATLRGTRHGGATQRVSALFAELESARRARWVVASRLRRGEQIPGFGHPLYPAGDPRAALLLRLAEASGNETQWRLAGSLADAASELAHDLPNLDFALVTLARTHHLPRRAPLVLFALGRAVGWIAHAIEQYAAGDLIRPRASYTGPPPDARGA
jgi:citrate synthase